MRGGPVSSVSGMARVRVTVTVQYGALLRTEPARHRAHAIFPMAAIIASTVLPLCFPGLACQDRALAGTPDCRSPPSPTQHTRQVRQPPNAHSPPPPPPLSPPPPLPPMSVYDATVAGAAAIYAGAGGSLVPCPISGGYAAPWHNGSLVCRSPTTGTCNSTFSLQKRLSGHGKCFPDGDFLVGQQIMWGGYGCYPGLDKVWVVNRCAARMTCENGRTVNCGTSSNNGHTNCSCVEVRL